MEGKEFDNVQTVEAVVREVKPEFKQLTVADLDKYAKDKIDGEGVVVSFSPKSLIERGEETADNFINFLSAKYLLPAEVIDAIRDWEKRGDAQ
jgi:hypothetical protein